jgi:hypothetical protein
VNHFPKVPDSDRFLIKTNDSGVVFEIIDINLSLSTDEVVEFLVVEHKKPFLVDNLCQSLPNKPGLVFQQSINFITSQQRNIQFFVFTKIIKEFTW